MKLRLVTLLLLALSCFFVLVACDEGTEPPATPPTTPTTPPAHTHAYGAWTEHNDTQHKKTCSCGNVVYAEHSGEWQHVSAEQHQRTCECGNVATAAHAYDTYQEHNDAQHKKLCVCGDAIEENHAYGVLQKLDGSYHQKTCACGNAVKSFHNYGDEWQNHDEKQHKQVCACNDTRYADHEWDQQNRCGGCNTEYAYTPGLVYELCEDSTDYYALTGLGTVTNPVRVVIQPFYNGLPVVEIGRYAFKDCTTLTEVVMPDSIETISGSAFYGCSELVSVNLPSKLLEIKSFAFNGCQKLFAIKLERAYVSLEQSAFKGCAALTEVTIPASAYVATGAFENCTALASIELKGKPSSIHGKAFLNTAYYNDAKNWVDGMMIINNVLICGHPDLAGEVLIPSGLEMIANGAFSGIKGITSVDLTRLECQLGNMVGGTVVASMFSSCTGLVSITLHPRTASIESSAFSGCSSLTTINNTDDLVYIGAGAFKNCSKLESFTIGYSVLTIGKGAFNGCSKLTSLSFTVTTGWYKADSDYATSGTAYTYIDAAAAAQNFVWDYQKWYHRPYTP